MAYLSSTGMLLCALLFLIFNSWKRPGAEAETPANSVFPPAQLESLHLEKEGVCVSELLCALGVTG